MEEKVKSISGQKTAVCKQKGRDHVCLPLRTPPAQCPARCTRGGGWKEGRTEGGKGRCCPLGMVSIAVLTVTAEVRSKGTAPGETPTLTTIHAPTVQNVKQIRF